MKKGKPALIVLSLLCLLSMALPAAAASWQDAQLLKREIPRPVPAVLPSEQAQEIPVLYALYRKRYLSGIEISADPVPADAAGQAALLSGKVEELREAGVLPQDCAQKIGKILKQPSSAAYTQEQDGFSGSIYHIYPGQADGPAGSVALQWHRKTELVTSCSVHAQLAPRDAAAFLDAYRKYLGLDALTDWETADTGGASTAYWSESGQIYLYYTLQSGRLSFGAIFLSREEFDASFSETF